MSNTALNKEEEYLDYILTIKQFFNRHRSGGYMFAVSYSYALKKEVNREIIDYCKDQNLNVGEARLEFDNDKTCLQQLQEAKEEFKNGLILSNIDELMLLTHDEFAYQLNQMREALFSLHIPILIWLTPENHNTFTHKAIDLYTRRDLDTLFFPEIKKEDTNKDLYERSELKLGQSEDAETLRTRIFLLEKQLETARNDDVPRNRIAKEIVFPLIKAYRQLLLLEQAMNLVEEFKEEFSNDNREVFVEFGQLYYKTGNLDIAIDYFEKALQLDIDMYGEESEYVSYDYNELALAWKEKEDLDKAIIYFEKAIAINLKLFGEESLYVASNYCNLGDVWRHKGNSNRAISYLEKAEAINLKLFGEYNSYISVIYNNLGLAWMSRGALNKATIFLEKALAVDLKLYGEYNSNIASIYDNLGIVWHHKEDSDKVLFYLNKALFISLKLLGEDNPNVAIQYNNLGTVWHDKGDLNKAKSFYQKAYNIYYNTYGAKHSYTKALKESIANIEKEENLNTKTIPS